MRSLVFTIVLAFACSVACAIEKVEVTCVDENATAYGTFQSHNQKVVANANGIFMTHIRSRNEAYTAQQWRLSRSTDGGTTFTTIFEATNATNPPVIESDAAANLYLIRPDFVDNNSYLYYFDAAKSYKDPRITPIPASAAGKFSMMLDAKRGQLYYFSHNDTFHILDRDGRVRGSVNLIAPGRHAVLQYPMLCMDGDVLHAAWTTSVTDKYLYWDIHSMQSPDGGRSWRKMDGSALTPPIIADDTGPADRISLDDEFEVHTWLSSFLIRDGKAHFLYLAQLQPWRQHYMRYDLKSAKREIDVQPHLKGEQIELSGLDGFFAAGADPRGTLYCTGHTPDGRIGCLASDDNGSTWHDHAQSEPLPALYAVGGCRTVTSDGSVIGSCTARADAADVNSVAKVYFFRIPPRRR